MIDLIYKTYWKFKIQGKCVLAGNIITKIGEIKCLHTLDKVPMKDSSNDSSKSNLPSDWDYYGDFHKCMWGFTYWSMDN